MAEFSKIVTGVGLPLNALNQTRKIHFRSMDVVTGETWMKNPNPNCTCCGGNCDVDNTSLWNEVLSVLCKVRETSNQHARKFMGHPKSWSISYEFRINYFTN